MWHRPNADVGAASGISAECQQLISVATQLARFHSSWRRFRLSEIITSAATFLWAARPDSSRARAPSGSKLSRTSFSLVAPASLITSIREPRPHVRAALRRSPVGTAPGRTGVGASRKAIHCRGRGRWRSSDLSQAQSVSGARPAFSPDFVALAVTNDAAAVASSAKRLRRLC